MVHDTLFLGEVLMRLSEKFQHWQAFSQTETKIDICQPCFFLSDHDKILGYKLCLLVKTWLWLKC